MLTPPPGLKVLVATKPIDFRKGADGLAALAQEVLKQNPLSGTALVFRAKRADRVKILVWDGSGLVLYWKRLENGAFKWPPVTDGVMRMNAAQLAALSVRDGLDAHARTAHAAAESGGLNVPWRSDCRLREARSMA